MYTSTVPAITPFNVINWSESISFDSHSLSLTIKPIVVVPAGNTAVVLTPCSSLSVPNVYALPSSPPSGQSHTFQPSYTPSSLK